MCKTNTDMTIVNWLNSNHEIFVFEPVHDLMMLKKITNNAKIWQIMFSFFVAILSVLSR